jgi:preprotein translocase subunit YajC
MIRPQIKRKKDEKRFVEALKKGDKIVTKSGLHGKIVDINDKDYSCIIETMAGRLKFDRSAISLEMSKKANEAKEKS